MSVEMGCLFAAMVLALVHLTVTSVSCLDYPIPVIK
mgnify:CR=1 FL=1